MKNKKPYTILSLIILLFSFYGCKMAKESQKISLPKVSNAYYYSYSVGENEKGYSVHFELPKNSIKPVAIIINKIKRPIYQSDYNNGVYNLNVIAQTTMNNHQIIVDNTSPSGLIFNIHGKKYLKPIPFKRKEK